jgi:uncharacterized OB-fold protein
VAPPRPTPIPEALSSEYYAAAAQGRLVVQRCPACERLQFYPRAHCASCHVGVPEWHDVSGRGVVHTFSVVRYTPNEEFADECPYVLAIVDLEEGVRMTSRIVGIAPEEVVCDMPVTVVFEARDGFTLPWFTPEAA